MRLAALALAATAALTGCAAPVAMAPPEGRSVYSPGLTSRSAVGDRPAPVREATADGAELGFVTALLADMNRRSFAMNREHCGYVGLDPMGNWMASPVIAGAEASCALPTIPPGMTVVASVHTHSTYSPYYASEWPTAQDVATDRASGIDGYISTPGGRLWHVDTDAMVVRDLCGRGCLPQDPGYVAADDGPLRPVMSYAQLQAWERAIGG